MDCRVGRFFEEMRSKKVVVLGLGVSHIDLVSRFRGRGVPVEVRDKRSREQIGDALCGNLEAQDVVLKLGEDYLEDLQADVVLRTPGMPFHHPVLTSLRKKGVVVTSEMELFFSLCPCKTIAVTGSDGKTTTTTLIAEILKEGGKRVHLGGNIGHPLMPLIQDIRDGDYAVAELSSFQLISMRQSPDVAVVTNISPNHLDIHKDMEEYVDAKKNILLHQDAFSRSVLGVDNQLAASLADLVRGELFTFSVEHPVENGAFLGEDGFLYAVYHNETERVIHTNELQILGIHNVQNCLAAIAATYGFVDLDAIQAVLLEFTGVEHRMEFVREYEGASWYNDSIATSPTRTIAGLEAFGKGLIVIAGGKDKKVPFDSLGEKLCTYAKALILQGPAADKIQQAVENAPNYSPDLKIYRVDGMEQAVEQAAAIAHQGDLVTLSPACTSFDAYANFEERGQHFKTLVNRLR